MRWFSGSSFRTESPVGGLVEVSPLQEVVDDDVRSGIADGKIGLAIDPSGVGDEIPLRPTACEMIKRRVPGDVLSVASGFPERVVLMIGVLR
jgi:hypothetical protein